MNDGTDGGFLPTKFTKGHERIRRKISGNQIVGCELASQLRRTWPDERATYTLRERQAGCPRNMLQPFETNRSVDFVGDSSLNYFHSVFHVAAADFELGGEGSDLLAGKYRGTTR